jgi:MFS-type transporter involved in bile tolerance (Atg22 family)
MTSMRKALSLALAAGAFAVGALQVGAQQLLAVGEMSPDFALPGATRFGVLANPVHLSDFRGETVVLSFFFKVRTPG